MLIATGHGRVASTPYQNGISPRASPASIASGRAWATLPARAASTSAYSSAVRAWNSIAH